MESTLLKQSSRELTLLNFQTYSPSRQLNPEMRRVGRTVPS